MKLAFNRITHGSVCRHGGESLFSQGTIKIVHWH